MFHGVVLVNLKTLQVQVEHRIAGVFMSFRKHIGNTVYTLDIYVRSQIFRERSKSL